MSYIILFLIIFNNNGVDIGRYVLSYTNIFKLVYIVNVNISYT